MSRGPTQKRRHFRDRLRKSNDTQGMCFGAFGAVFPYINILLGNGEFRWEKTKTKTRIPCADPKGIILEIERV